MRAIFNNLFMTFTCEKFNCLLNKLLLQNLHILPVLNKKCTEAHLVRYVEGIYIYTDIKNQCSVF